MTPNTVPWQCAGCGAEAPDRVKTCDCPTRVVTRGKDKEWCTEWCIEHPLPAAWLVTWSSANGDSGQSPYIKEEDARWAVRNIEMYFTSKSAAAVTPLYAQPGEGVSADDVRGTFSVRQTLPEIGKEIPKPATERAHSEHRRSPQPGDAASACPSEGGAK